MMIGLPLRDGLLLAIWLLVFAEIFLISVRAMIRDHCRRVQLKRKLRLRSKRNETRIRG